MKKYQYVFYTRCGKPVLATVERVWCDGTVTIMAHHYIGDDGRAEHDFLGHRFRCPKSILRHTIAEERAVVR